MPKRVVKPTGKCAVCKHPERVRIELMQAQGGAVRALARKFGLSFYAIHRHWHVHVSDERKSALMLGPVHRQALAARVAEESGGVLDHFKVVGAGLYQLYDAAVTAGDRVGGAMLAGRLHENLNARAKLTGQLASSPLVQINNQTVLVQDPGFMQFQADLIRVLARFPEARAAVIAEFERLDQQPTSSPALEHQPREDSVDEH